MIGQKIRWMIAVSAIVIAGCADDDAIDDPGDGTAKSQPAPDVAAPLPPASPVPSSRNVPSRHRVLNVATEGS